MRSALRLWPLMLLTLLCAPAWSYASVYFVGATQYSANTANGAVFATGYRHTTNSIDPGSSAFPLDYAGDAIGPVFRDIAFELAIGDNVFTFDRSTASQSASGYGLTLYFNNTGTTLTAPTSTTSPAPHLAVYSAVSTPSTFAIPNSGISVDAFGAITTNVAYGGATSYLVDGKTVTVTGYTVQHATFNSGGPIGSFVIHVTPEPASVVLLGAGLAVLARRKTERA